MQQTAAEASLRDVFRSTASGLTLRLAARRLKVFNTGNVRSGRIDSRPSWDRQHRGTVQNHMEQPWEDLKNVDAPDLEPEAVR